MSKNRQSNQNQQNQNDQNVRVVYKIVTAEQYARIQKLEAAEKALRPVLNSTSGKYNVDLNGADGGNWTTVKGTSRRARRQAARKVTRRTAPVAKTPSFLEATRNTRRWMVAALMVTPVVWMAIQSLF